MTTRGRKKKQEQMKNSNQPKNLEISSQNIPFEPPIKRSRGRPRKNLLTNLKSILSQTKRKRGRPRKQIYENELPEINMQKGSRTKVESDSDSDPDSDPEYLDYLKEIQAKKNYFSTSEDEVIDIEPEDEENCEKSFIEEIFENQNIERF